MPSFINTVLDAVREHNMLEPGMSVLTGVSGGPDSVALLDVLTAVSGSFRLRLGIAHLHHGLRPGEADLDAEFVQTIAKRLGLSYFERSADIRTDRLNTGRSLEEAARDVRHHFLHEVARRFGYEKIALGHHRDDHSQQVLMNLLRGAGPDGLCGIAPVRGKIIRPLIRATRSDILTYLVSRGLMFRIDSSNEDLRYLRNKIRLQLLPDLQKMYNPAIVEGLSRLGKIMQSEKDWISGIVEPAFSRMVRHREEDMIDIRIDHLLPCHPALQRRLVRKAIEEVKGDLRRITWVNVESAINLIKPEQDGLTIHLPDRIQVARQAGRLVISRENRPLRSIPKPVLSPGPYAYILSKARVLDNQPFYIPEAGVSLNFEQKTAQEGVAGSDIEENESLMDMGKLTFPITVRNFQPGDRFVPLGLKGKQKLKKFFIDHKVDPVKRKTLPLLVSENDIIWVGGIRIAEPVKITPSTQVVLRVMID